MSRFPDFFTGRTKENQSIAIIGIVDGAFYKVSRENRNGILRRYPFVFRKRDTLINGHPFGTRSEEDFISLEDTFATKRPRSDYEITNTAFYLRRKHLRKNIFDVAPIFLQTYSLFSKDQFSDTRIAHIGHRYGRLPEGTQAMLRTIQLPDSDGQKLTKLQLMIPRPDEGQALPPNVVVFPYPNTFVY